MGPCNDYHTVWILNVFESLPIWNVLNVFESGTYVVLLELEDAQARAACGQTDPGGSQFNHLDDMYFFIHIDIRAMCI